MANINTDVNQFPSLTWNHLNINRTHLDVSIQNEAKLSISDLPKGIELSSISVSDFNSRNPLIETGLGKVFDNQYDALISDNNTLIKEFNVKASSDVPVRISYFGNDGENASGDIVINADENTESTFIIDSSSNKDNGGVFGLRVRVITKPYAIVHLVTVNMLGSNYTGFTSIGSEVADNANIDLIQLELGGKDIYSGTYHRLNGYKSAVNNNIGYVVNKDHSLDINYVARQTGKETESFMHTDGVVMDSARKAWRGTIDFVKGCKESKGDEQEDVLLLNPDVTNKSLPVILCDEEDVEGRHGASIGRLGKEILFYMQSRGVDEKTAQQLMIKAKIASICKNINDDCLVTQIHDFVEGEFTK